MARSRYRVTAISPPKKFTPAAQGLTPALAVDTLEVNALPVVEPGQQWGKGFTFAARTPASVIGFYIPLADAAWLRVGTEFYLDLVPATPDAT